MVNNVATFLSSEGFETTRNGIYHSKEISVTITTTATPTLFDVDYDGFIYKDIEGEQLDVVIEAIHVLKGTARVVVLYNLQRAVLLKLILPIKEDN